MARLGDKIAVTCTDNGKVVNGVLHRISKDKIEVVIQNDAVIHLNRKPNTSLFVGSKGGMEFTASLK